MDSSQESSNVVKTVLTPITSIEQLVGSHLVADIIIDIREDLDKRNNLITVFNVPDLDTKLDISNRAIDLYKRAAKILKSKPQLIIMLKIGIEDLFRYSFSEDPSVVTAGSNDTVHLQQVFGPRFTDLRGINLLDHTLNVLEQGLIKAESSGRASGMSIGILGSLFHDFGKSTVIRSLALGEGLQRGYKAHAEVSEMYIQDLLLNKLYNVVKEDIVAIELVDSLAKVVRNHHPANAKMKEDLEINFVIIADQEARKNEFRSLKRR